MFLDKTIKAVLIYRMISPETKYMHLMEAIEEAQLKFDLKGLKVKQLQYLGKDNQRFNVKDGKEVYCNCSTLIFSKF